MNGARALRRRGGPAPEVSPARRTLAAIVVLVLGVAGTPALGGAAHAAEPTPTGHTPGAPTTTADARALERSTNAATLPGADAETLFAEANKRYFAGDWAGAVEAYAAIVERFEVEDAVLYHNLGNACFRSGAYGSAILYYRRAQQLGPDAALAESLDRNLDAARRTLQARYRDTSDSTFVYADPSGVVYQVTHLVGETTLALAFAALWCVFFALLAWRRLRPGVRWAGRVAVPVGVLVALAGALVWGRLASDADRKVGVVVSSEALLRDGKHEIAKGTTLQEGLEVRILDGDNAWTQVERADGKRGWVEANHVKQI